MRSDDHLPADDEDSIDIEPRAARLVYRRAVLLASLVRRAVLEEPNPDADDKDAFERETDRFELYSWAMKEMGGDATEIERALLRTPAGELDPEEVDDCLASAIPANALRWALDGTTRLDLKVSQEATIQALLDWAPGPWEDVDQRSRNVSTHSDDVLASERERWELWYWRSTLDKSNLDPGECLEDVVADVAQEAAGASRVEVSDGDFGFDGRPFRDLPDEEQARIADLAEGYLIALNWVCGFGDSWDDVPLYPE